MLSQKALKHFKLFRNPFLDEVRSSEDVYLTEDMHYVLAAMRDAARNRGLLAVVGDSGSGKSILRKMLVDDLNKEGDVAVITPRIIDKSRITAGGLCDAIIRDLSDEVIASSLEAKARQVERLLRDRSRAGQRHVILIEEAHDLSVYTLKYLKRFWELEDGFERLLGIILVGQTELGDLLDERCHPEARELIRRCMVVKIGPLGKDLPSYLAHKFNRLGIEPGRVYSEDVPEAIQKRLSRKSGGGRAESFAYPLVVQNLLVRAMNMTAELGEPLVSAEAIMEA